MKPNLSIAVSCSGFDSVLRLELELERAQHIPSPSRGLGNQLSNP